MEKSMKEKSGFLVSKLADDVDPDVKVAARNALKKINV